ncbi:cytochrome D1 domain-containing protein [Ottowia caeni]|uniref:cytochrome D1 domain-containing protein n=1 Tax=Ottowia caeni TaxID=2870339 RepID=UPI001E361553|nr:cytochrome C oxidase Cbb3 [Ottowia caeni]
MKTSYSWALSAALTFACSANLCAKAAPGVTTDAGSVFAQQCNGVQSAPQYSQTTWGEAYIASSRTETPGWREWPSSPQWTADPKNLFVVVEGGDRPGVTLLDGGRLEPIHRFTLRSALRGVPKFAPDGRYAYFGSNDGWITKVDLWNLRITSEIRAGINLCDMVLSSDGKWLMAATEAPHTLALFDADLNLRSTYFANTLDGRQRSPISAVYDARPRKSFIVALNDIPELWEISYNPAAEPIYDGLVHDYKMGEGIAKPGYLGVRRTRLDAPLKELAFDESHAYALGTSQMRVDESSIVQVVNLDVRRKITELVVKGKPNLRASITFEYQGTRVLAVPNLHTGVVSVIDVKTWKLLKNIETPGPGYFIRSHEATPYAWTHSINRPADGHALTIIDKRTLEVVTSVMYPYGQAVTGLEFTADGHHVLVSLSGDHGFLIIYDAATLKEIKRLPMRNPTQISTPSPPVLPRR